MKLTIDKKNHEVQSVVTERFIRTLKIKIYKYITSVSKNVYIDNLDDIVYKYNNPYHSIIKMETVDEFSRTYIDFNREHNQKDRKSEDDDHKYRNTKTLLQKVALKIDQKKCLFVIERVRYCSMEMLLAMKKLLGRFTKIIEKNKSKRV